MKAREFVVESAKTASAEQVWNYVDGIHPDDQKGGGFLKKLILRNPQYELRRVPLSSIHIPDQEYDDEEQDPKADPYNRVQTVDPEHAGEYSANFVDRRPIVVDGEGWIIDGNHRAWAAANLLNKNDIMAWVPAKKLTEIERMSGNEYTGGKKSLRIGAGDKNIKKLPGTNAFVYSTEDNHMENGIIIKLWDSANIAPKPVQMRDEDGEEFAWRLRDWERNQSEDGPGTLIGKLVLEDVPYFPLKGALQVDTITVDEDYRGQGVAKSLYGIVLSILRRPLLAGRSQTPGGRRNWASLASIPGVDVKGYIAINESRFANPDSDQDIDTIMGRLGGQYIGPSRPFGIHYFAFDVVPGSGELAPAVKTKMSQIYDGDSSPTGLYAVWSGSVNEQDSLKQTIKEGQSVKQEIKDFIYSLTPADVGVEEFPGYRVHFEGFTDDCKLSSDYQKNPNKVYQQVYQDFIDREGGEKPVKSSMVGDEEYPILYSVFKVPQSKTIDTAEKAYSIAYKKKRPWPRGSREEKLIRSEWQLSALYDQYVLKQGMTEGQLNELGNAPADYKPNRKRKRSLFHSTVDNHWVDVFFDRSEFNNTLHITFTVNGDYDTPSQPTSASKSTVRILSTVLNVIKQQLPEYVAKTCPPGISFTAKGDNRANLYRRYFVPVVQNILGPKWQHEEYPSMGMTVFHWKPVRKQDVNEISDERLQNYLSRADRQVSNRLDRMSQARERLNKGYEIYHADRPAGSTQIVDRFEANTPALAQQYYEKFIRDYVSDVDFDLRLRRSTGIVEYKDANIQKTTRDGIDLSFEKVKDDEYVSDDDNENTVIYVTATSNGKELGHVLFSIDGNTLLPQDLEVNERYRGQGIAKIMYDYVKSLGYQIRRSGQQTDAGAGFWSKHRNGQNVWESELDEIARIPQSELGGWGDKDTLEPMTTPPKGRKPLPGGSGYTYAVNRGDPEFMEIMIFDGDTLAAELDLFATLDPLKTWRVETVITDPDYRGRGLGKALYGIALSILRLTIEAGDQQTKFGQQMWLMLSSIPGVEVLGYAMESTNRYRPRPGDRVVDQNDTWTRFTFPVEPGKRSMRSTRSGTGIYSSQYVSMIAKWTGR